MKVKEQNQTLLLLDDTNKVIGNLEFTKTDNALIITRPFIESSLGGNGFAEFLLDRASEIANKENLKLASVCYYGIKYIEKNGSVAKFPKRV